MSAGEELIELLKKRVTVTVYTKTLAIEPKYTFGGVRLMANTISNDRWGKTKPVELVTLTGVSVPVGEKVAKLTPAQERVAMMILALEIERKGTRSKLAKAGIDQELDTARARLQNMLERKLKSL